MFPRALGSCRLFVFRCLGTLTLLVLLCALGTLPYLLSGFSHTELPWPVSLLGVDTPAGALAQRVRAHTSALQASQQLSATESSHEASVAYLAAGLAALPAFGGASAARALHICTVASRSQPGLELLQATAAHFGVQVKVLGMGDAQLVQWGQGLGRKALHVAEYVASLPPHDVVMLVDAYDAVFMGRPTLEAYFRGLARALLREPVDPATATAPDASAAAAAAAGALPPTQGAALSEQALQRLLTARRPPSLLFSAERECMDIGPPGSAAEAAAEAAARAGARFPCLNSGGFMGPAAQLHALLTSLDWGPYMANDQVGFYHALRRSRARTDLPLVVLDQGTEVFLTMLGVDVAGEVLQLPQPSAQHPGLWLLAGSPPSARPCLWHYPSYYKRMSGAVELLTGRLGAGGAGALRTSIAIAWGLMGVMGVAGALLALWGCSRSSGSGGGGGGAGAAAGLEGGGGSGSAAAAAPFSAGPKHV